MLWTNKIRKYEMNGETIESTYLKKISNTTTDLNWKAKNERDEMITVAFVKQHENKSTDNEGWRMTPLLMNQTKMKSYYQFSHS